MSDIESNVSATGGTALVVGASGFLGSHVVKALCASGRPVRALVRRSSNIGALEGLPCEIHYGDVLDRASLDAAMAGCSAVYHCVVDTRAWLDDPTPLFRCNVDGLVNSMEAALTNDVHRFVFTSSIATIGLNANRKPSEADLFNWQDRAPAYILSRVQAEQALLTYCRERQLPGVALCVANTYGPADIQPTPHGEMLWDAARGAAPVALDCGAPWVDVRDAAQALLLAEQRGRIGERYIVAAGFISHPELYARAAALLGNDPPARLSLWVAYTLAWINQRAARLIGRKDVKLRTDSVLLSHIFADLDNSKIGHELNWTPRPLDETLRDAVQWFDERARVAPDTH